MAEKYAGDSDNMTLIRKRWKDAKKGLSDWREQAREDFDFAAGHQWSDKDMATMNDQGRPAVTFNRVGAMVDAVSGLEINNRQEVRYYPREIGDVQVNEVFTDGAKWARDSCYAEDEETEAFRDAVICGVGVTETRMDYEEELEGMIRIERKDPLTVFWDPASRSKNLSDARYVFESVWMDKEDVKKKWPKAEESFSGDDMLEKDATHLSDRSFLYEQGSIEDSETRADQVLVLHYQCYKLEARYRVLDPFQGKLVELTQAEFSKLEKNIAQLGMRLVGQGSEQGPQDIPYVKQQKKVYYRGFSIGETELSYDKSPCQHGFTLKFITGKRDRNKAMWYGIVRPMKDPQRFGNKFFSQILDIMAKNVKGGAFYEDGALLDKNKAERQWASPNPLIALKEGAIDKIRERTPAQYPTGLDRLMSFSFDSLPMVSGIPLEAMGILAPLFDSLRRYRKEQGKILLYFIKEYLSDGRLVRILGETGNVKYVPMTKQEGTILYDVVVDEAPTSPDFKQRTWEAMQSILPIMLKQGYPVPPVVYKYAPLPTDVANALAESANGVLPPAAQERIGQAEQAISALQEENASLKEQLFLAQADKSMEQAKLVAKDADSQRKAAVKIRDQDINLAVAQIGNNPQAEAENAATEMANKRELGMMDIGVKREKNLLDHSAKVQKNQLDAKAKKQRSV
jgi:hypothetical protein